MDSELQEALKGIGELVEKLGYENAPAAPEWWTRVPLPELGGRTLVETWLAGEHEAVRHVMHEMVRASEDARNALAADPSATAAILARLEHIS